MTAREDAARMADPSYFAKIAPHLSLDGPIAPPLPLHAPVGRRLADDLRRDGYFVHDPGFDPALARRLRDGVMLLRRAGLPAVFIWMYADTWSLVARHHAIWQATMGENYRVMPCFWAWHIPIGEQHGGWAVHRDRTKGPPNVGAGGRPLALSAWIPLTSATPENGCMYVVPAPWAPERAKDIELANVRALPASPSAVLAWRQDVLHWGGRSSNYADEPRIAIGIELQRGDVPAFDQPLLDAWKLPSYRHRLAFLGANLWRYRARTVKALHPLAKLLIATAPELEHTFPDAPMGSA
jgi:hypothetical protein